MTEVTATSPAPTPRTPHEALRTLLEGNRRFIAGVPAHPNQDAERRAELARHGQRPFAVLFGCSDSRLAAEIIFDRGLGDLFVVRTAGHVLGPEVLGTIEYGTSVLGAPLIVVLGHDDCGAVRAAITTQDSGSVPPGFVRDVVERLGSHVHAARACGITDPNTIARRHVAETVDLLLQRSRVIADAVNSGTVGVAGLAYRLSDGLAEVLTTHGL